MDLRLSSTEDSSSSVRPSFSWLELGPAQPPWPQPAPRPALSIPIADEPSLCDLLLRLPASAPSSAGSASFRLLALSSPPRLIPRPLSRLFPSPIFSCRIHSLSLRPAAPEEGRRSRRRMPRVLRRCVSRARARLSCADALLGQSSGALCCWCVTFLLPLPLSRADPFSPSTAAPCVSFSPRGFACSLVVVQEG